MRKIEVSAPTTYNVHLRDLDLDEEVIVDSISDWPVLPSTDDVITFKDGTAYKVLQRTLSVDQTMSVELVLRRK